MAVLLLGGSAVALVPASASAVSCYYDSSVTSTPDGRVRAQTDISDCDAGNGYSFYIYITIFDTKCDGWGPNWKFTFYDEHGPLASIPTKTYDGGGCGTSKKYQYGPYWPVTAHQSLALSLKASSCCSGSSWYTVPWDWEVPF
jgi:hypothetical protein